MMRDGWPVLATIHHPITVDRELDLAQAEGWQRRLTLRRWYGFVGMQARVARQVQRIVTVSESSRRDIADQLGVASRAHDGRPGRGRTARSSGQCPAPSGCRAGS